MDFTYNIELITAALDYAELNMVKYEGIEKVVIFEVAIKLDVTDEHTKMLKEFKKGLDLFFSLKNLSPKLVDLTIEEKEGIGFIRFYRDIHTVDIAELDMFINFSNYYLSSSLIKDDYPNYSILHNSYLKKNILEQAIKTPESDYLVYRHKGKVVVYNS